MKSIQEIERLSADDLRRIGEDSSIPVPEDLHVSLPQRRYRPWSIAAAAAVIIALAGWGLSRPAQPKDTFDDPYLAYAAVEQALNKMSGNIHSVAGKVEESQSMLDKINYWK